jgi:hypothetical protein
VRGCFEPLEGSLGIALCSGLVAGQRRASVTGIGLEESSSEGAYAAATFELELSGQFFGPLGAYTTLGLAAPFVQDEIPLALRNGGDAESPRVDITFQLTTGLRVWIDP